MTDVSSGFASPDYYHPPGVVALPVGEIWRYSRTALCFMALDLPPGSSVKMLTGMDVTLALNMICEEMLSDPENRWIWFQSDDHFFERDMLNRLLNRNLDVVVPLIARRSPPWNLVVYSGENGEEINEHGISTPAYETIDPSNLPDGGVFPVHAAGSGGMLVGRNVLENIPYPWFENSHGSYINDDLEFCRKIREAGFEIHADVECVMGHVSQYMALPDYREERERWGIGLEFGDGTGTNRIWFGDDPRKLSEQHKETAA